MKKREIPVMNVGISLIILIFMNICLAAFAVLSLENAVSDYSLSKKTAKHTTQYYEAVNNVQEQLAKKNQELREKAETTTTEAESSQKKAETKTLLRVVHFCNISTDYRIKQKNQQLLHPNGHSNTVGFNYKIDISYA